MIEPEDLGDDDMALGHFEVKTCDRFPLETIIRLIMKIFYQGCSLRYHEVNKKEVSRT